MRCRRRELEQLARASSKWSSARRPCCAARTAHAVCRAPRSSASSARSSAASWSGCGDDLRARGPPRRAWRGARSRAPTSHRATASRASRRRTSLPFAIRIARPWPSLSSPSREQLEHVVGQVEQPDQVRDRRAGAAEAAGELLLRQPELLDQGRAGARLVDRVQVLAGDVLDQRRLHPPARRPRRGPSPGRRRARPRARRASGARRRSARSGRRAAGGRSAAGSRRPRRSTRPAPRSSRGRSAPRLVGVGPDQIDRHLAVGGLAGPLTRAGSPRGRGPCPRRALTPPARSRRRSARGRSSSRGERPVGGRAARARGVRRAPGTPWLGASATRTLLGITVSNTCSGRWLSQLRLDILGEAGPLVVHRDQHAGQNQRRVEARGGPGRASPGTGRDPRAPGTRPGPGRSPDRRPRAR